jgi:hypothetical protein
MSKSFEATYPNITHWVEAHGWIEIGADEYSTSLVRVLDEGGMVWESEDDDSLDAALKAGDTAVAKWLAEKGLA